MIAWIWNWILFIGSIFCMALGVYFLLRENLFLSLVSIIVSSYFSSTRKYHYLQTEINDLKKKTNNIPLICFADYEELAKALNAKTLTGGVFYCVSNVPTIDCANRMMDLVRDYKAI